MLFDGIQLAGAAVVSNFSIESGSTLPTVGNNLGELFYKTGASAGLYVYNGSAWDGTGGGGGTPGGANTQIQFNSAGAFAGAAGLTWDGTTLTATNLAGIGSSITALSASNISSGTVGSARLGTGTASSSTYLRGDGTWAALIASGSNGQVQWNSSGVMTGAIGLVWDSVTGTLTSPKFSGNGSSITSIDAGNISTGTLNSARTENSGVTAGAYAKVTVDAKGRVTIGGTLDSSDVTTGLGFTPANKAGDTFTGAIILNADPSAALGAATKQYVDNLASGLNTHQACATATTASLTATYSNGSGGVGSTLTGTGALPTIGGYASLTTADRVLVKDQASGIQNGIYVVTTLSPNWVLTRASDFDNSPVGEVQAGDFTFIQQGTLAGTGWVQTTPNVITVGTSNIVFSQFTGAGGSVTGGTGITVTGNSVAITSIGTAGTYKSVTTNAQGQVTAGSNPTTLAGFGITDALALTGGSLTGGLSIASGGTLKFGTVSASGTGVSGINGASNFHIDAGNTAGGAFQLHLNYFSGTGGVFFGNGNTGSSGASVSSAGVFTGSGSGLTALNASNLSSGTVGTARLGTGTANSTTYLRGDGTWTASPGILASTNNTFTAAQRGQVSVLTYGATVTPNFDASNNFSVTLTGNMTLANPSGTVTPGQSGIIAITQDGTGSRTISWGSSYVGAGGIKPSLSTTGNAIDLISYYVVSSTKIFVTGSLGVA